MALTAPSSTLTGQTIADSYDQVLFLDSAAGVTEATLKIVSGTAGKTALSISDEHVLIKGVDTNNAAGFEVQQTDGTSILKIAAGTPSVLVSGSGVKLYFSDAGGEYLSGDGTDLTITSGNDIVFALGATGSVYHTGDGGSNNTIYGLNAGVALASGGNQNVLLGEGAGTALTTGDNNTVIGYLAFAAAADDETSNVAIGVNAMGAADQGSHPNADVDQNVCIGVNAGFGGDFGSSDLNFVDNVAIGYNSMDGTGAIGGIRNVFVGSETGGGSWATASSNYNVGIGHNTMDAAMNGADYNTGVGYATLSGLTEGDNNVAIGKAAGNDISTGSDNVMIGFDAGDKTADVDKAIIIGSGAGGAVMTSAADGTVAIGYTALAALTSGARNTAVGYQTLDAMTQGDDNIAIGYQALSALGSTDGCDKNIAIGNYAMDAADGNEAGHIAIGHNSLGALNTNGAERTICIGIEAGASLNSADADYNIIMGYAAGTGGTGSLAKCVVIGGYAMNATAGNAQTGTIAIGYDALGGLTSGASNTVVGYLAGDALTTGYENTVLGKNALGADVGGGRSVAIGFNALETQTGVTGHQFNTSVGAYSGRYVSTGTENTFIGYYAGYGASGTPTTGSYNTVVGSSAGGALEGAGADNTLIGRAAGSTITTGTSNVIIGSSAAPSSATGTNQIAIGGTGQGDNTVTLGNASVDDVYMASDSYAHVHCGSITVKPSAGDDSLGGLAGIQLLRGDDVGPGWNIRISAGGTDGDFFIDRLQSASWQSAFNMDRATGDAEFANDMTIGGSYSPFTGSHTAQLIDDEEYHYGELVQIQGLIQSGKDIVYQVNKTTGSYQRNVLGAFGYVEDLEFNNTAVSRSSAEDEYMIFVIGDGHILCNGEKGNLAVGDGICSSTTVGQGMKADQMAMIIGIAQEDVSFSGDESKLVAVQYGLQQFTPWT